MVRLIIQPFLLVRLPEFVFDISKRCTIESLSVYWQAWTSRSRKKSEVAEVALYHSIHLIVTSQTHIEQITHRDL